MMLPRFPRFLAASVAVPWLAMGAVSPASAQDTLARAKDLYVTAAYDEALVLLGRLHQGAAAEDATEIAGYQVFCLLALGRTEDANRAIEALVKSDPLYRPSEATASPRTRAAFDDVRKGLLPRIVQEMYDKGKASYDNKDPQAAVAQFDRVLEILNEPGLIDQPGMADLRRLASGFRDLSHSAAEVAAAAAATPKKPDPPAATDLLGDGHGRRSTGSGHAAHSAMAPMERNRRAPRTHRDHRAGRRRKGRRRLGRDRQEHPT
jgi:tetratricopeptide (TPR) repeat protein